MVALYERWVFKGINRMWRENKLEFLGEWLGSEQEFFEVYHKKYPNERLQIYKHKFKPLSRDLRLQIEDFMTKDPYFVQLNRDEKLNSLLG
jgi:hypothetical protein